MYELAVVIMLVLMTMMIKISPGQTRKHCCENICDSRCFLKCFSCLPTRGNIVAETKLACWLAKMFPIKFRNISCFPSVIFVAETLFPSGCPPLGNMAKDWQETKFGDGCDDDVGDRTVMVVAMTTVMVVLVATVLSSA